MADRILDGRLVEHLRELRGARGFSYERIAQELGGHGVATTATTVGAWLAALGIDKGDSPTAKAAS